ncbi:site-specific integrase [Hydrogenophaga crocea]|uniref:Site-specific integrase n=1 Tax=Hydrogenophaga crocea TaxID=2716225 RepID=A0A6G8IJS6_9BURK|nr:site-specific integrase [Hydrogenophaga crocea]
MGSIRRRPESGLLFLDFKYLGQRLREQTALPDTEPNRKRLQKALERIEGEIALGTFDYEKTFGKPLPAKSGQTDSEASSNDAEAAQPTTRSGTPLFKDFADMWFAECEVSWRRSYRVTQRGSLDQYLIPYFGDKEVGHITKADVLAFRASLAKVPARKSLSTLSNRRINSVMKPLRQILNEAADRLEFTSAFRNIKPLKMKRTDVMPFTLEEVQQILTTVRADFRNYFTVRFFTGMRTGEVHGLKWKYIDFERRLILVREAIVMKEEDELKTDGSVRDIQMTDLVFDALQAQFKVTGKLSEFVFCNRKGEPIDNQNFLNRVWSPLLRHLNIPHRRAYQMRHTAATLWLAAGEAPEWIARQLGHTSTEMLFRVYSRYVPNLTRRDGSAMERLLKQHISVAPVQGLVVRLPEEAAMLPAAHRAGAHAASAETAANDALDPSALVSQPGAPLQGGQASSAPAANEAQAFEVLPAPRCRKAASGAESRNRTVTDPGEAELAALLRPPPLPPFLRHGS